MSDKDKVSEKDKLRFIAKELLPIRVGEITTRSREIQFPDRSKVNNWLDDIKFKQLDETDQILFLEIGILANSYGYPDEAKVLAAKTRPELEKFGGAIRNIDKKFYETPFKQFCYHLSILQMYTKYMEQVLANNVAIMNQLKDIFLDFKLKLLLVNFYNLVEHQKFFENRKKLLETGDYDAINTIMIIEVENLIYKLAQKARISIYGEEKNTNSELVIKQVIKPEVILKHLQANEELKGYAILFQSILMTLYDQKYPLFLERRYLQRMNGKLPISDEYLTAILMVFAVSLNYIIEQL